MKKRDQPIYTYFESLQLEYLLYELRRKIYVHKKDKKYCEKVMSFKCAKITNIAKRNSLQDIFNDEGKREEFRLLVYGKKGYPNFGIINYKTQEERLEFEQKDRDNYYSIGCDYRVEVEEDVFKIGSLVEIFHDKGICHIKLRKERDVTVSSISCLTRIL